MNAHPAAPAPSRATRFVLAAGAIAAVGFALAFSAAAPDIAQVAVPHQLALRTAQIGIAAPTAQAAPAAVEVVYLPARIAVQGVADEALPPQF
jgi:hypothetical protein